MINEDTNRIKNASDRVNHPSHYQNIIVDGEKYESIDLIHSILNYLDLPGDMSGDLFNVLKYLFRFPYKHPNNRQEDLQKSTFYLSRMTDNLKRHLKTHTYHQYLPESTDKDVVTLVHNNDFSETIKPQFLAEQLQFVNLPDNIDGDSLHYYLAQFLTLLLVSTISCDQFTTLPQYYNQMLTIMDQLTKMIADDLDV